MKVARPRFGLKTVTPRLTADDNVPSPLVTRGWKRNLGEDAQRAMQLLSKPIQQRCVSRVPQRLTTRVQAHRQVKSDRCEQGRSLFDGDASHQATFDPAVLGARYPKLSSERRTTEVAIDSSKPQFAQDGRRQFTAAT